MTCSRRWLLKSALIGGAEIVAASPLSSTSSVAVEPTQQERSPRWAKGIEGQRKADLGNGSYLNPILAGDHPDPSILKDGDDYYMTFSSFEAQPALVIWHSRDLVNWTPLTTALNHSLGSVFAVDLCKHNGRFYIYIPVIPTSVSEGMDGRSGIYAIHADDIKGPWSAPVSLNIAGYIDPGHIVGEDGKRYLFLSGISRVRLSDAGLATDGPIEHVYDGWKYPEDWIVEAYSLEGPKMLRHNGWFYLVSAVGGTAGPPTGHMVIVARSRSIHGPWQNHPHNPIIHTANEREYWWSRGHATFVEGPSGDWWTVYHGFENGYRTLGRQTLLEPIEWRVDGWPYALGGDLSKPIATPKGGQSGPHAFALSDDFAENRIGRQWTFYAPAKEEKRRLSYENGALVIAGKGGSPSDCSPLTCLVGDHAYEISVEMEVAAGAEGGLLLFYNRNLYLGMGHNRSEMLTYQFGKKSFFWKEPAPKTNDLHLRIVNDRHIVTFFYSTDGSTWRQHGLRSETSGYNTNTAGDLLSLRPGLFSAGGGVVRFRNFRYRAL
ncbi:MAG TPA: family 43 glycosylhydrolase [Terriglobales bacterium]|nr:family 43 glycosylhydrolase [Terriglobales bacterium]